MAKFISSGSESEKKIKEMEEYLQLVKSPSKLKQAQEAAVKKTPWYKKVISILSAGETGQAAYDMLEGKNPIASYGSSIIDSLKGTGYDKRTYADVLEKVGMKKTFLSEKLPWLYNETGKGLKFKKGGFIDPTDTGSLGLALDILGDPTTYLGGIGLFKRIGKGLSGLTKEGVKLSDDIVGAVEKSIVKDGIDGTEEAIKRMNKAGNDLGFALKENPDKYFKGITFMGKEIIPRKYALASGRLLDKTMGHVPVLNKVYEGLKYGVQDVFKLGADTIRNGAKAGIHGEITAERYIKNKLGINKLINYANDNLFQELKSSRELFLKATDKGQRDAITQGITESIEKNLKDIGIEGVDKKLGENLLEKFKTYSDTFYKDEKAAKELLDQDIYEQLSGYMPHILTPEAKKALAKKNVNISKLQGWRAWSTKSEKTRNLFKFVDENGKDVLIDDKPMLGTPESFNLKSYSKEAEEKFLTKKADELIERRQKDIDGLLKELNKLEEAKLQEALRPREKVLPKKTVELKVTPKGTPKLTKVGKTSTGLDLFRKSFSTRDKYILKTAELKPSETKKFIEALINTPSKEIAKFEKAMNRITGKKIPNLGKEINDIKASLQRNIDNLPEADRWYVAPDKKIYKADRTMTIKETNEMMQESMDALGQTGKKFLMTDPFEITLARGMESNRKIQYTNFLSDTVNQFGKKGEFIKQYSRNATTRKSKVEKILKEFTDPDTGIKYIDPKIPELPEGTLLPDFIVEDIKKTTTMMSKDELPNKLLDAYDKVMRVWKGSVYGWYPASHGRNLIGGAWNNFLANPSWVKFIDKTKPIIQGKDGDIVLNGTKYSNKTIQQQIGKSGILQQTGYIDVNNLNKTFNKGFWDKIESIPIGASTMVENNLRVPLFLAEVDKGKSFEEAAKTVFKYHFDYAPEGLTAIEKSVFKRLIPFYTWNRKNVPLMLEEIIAQPAKMTGLFKAVRNLTDEDGNVMQDLLPSSLQYLEKGFPITRKGATITAEGLPPVEMFKFLNQPEKTLESGLTPILKIPIELRTNFNLYKDKAISEDVNGEFARNYPQVVKDWLEWEDSSFKDKSGKEISYSRVEPFRKYWLYALPTGRFASIFSRFMDEEQTGKLLNGLTGIRTFELDMDNLKRQTDKEYEKVLLDILESSGVYSTYGTPYKESKKELKQLK